VGHSALIAEVDSPHLLLSASPTYIAHIGFPQGILLIPWVDSDWYWTKNHSIIRRLIYWLN